MLEHQFDLDGGANSEVIASKDENIATLYQGQEPKGEVSHKSRPIISRHDVVFPNIEPCEPHGSMTGPNGEFGTRSLNATSFILDVTINSVMDQHKEKLEFLHDVQFLDFLGLE
ncbi:hypothetical protein RHMOL_Rhmol05G0006800 [Rhododendron molle]|uniref:Uncharacterized protein n=1 Tax=Rhododendron molle TaxID=49168 RepID=A0ACC0NLG0_RHOML|nr:hypothetical protein RHMOL_Rhmol05G0006800 [Rhododendron molle]